MKRKANKPRPASVVKDGRDFTPDDWDAKDELGHLAYLTAAATSAGHPLAKRMLRADARVTGPGDTAADFEEMAALKRELFELPPAKLAEIFNGWPPRPKRINRERWEKMNATILHRCLVFTVRNAHPLTNRAQHVDTVIDYELNDYPCPVRVAIREGTSKAEAYRWLAEVMMLVATDYERMIAEPDDNYYAG